MFVCYYTVHIDLPEPESSRNPEVTPVPRSLFVKNLSFLETAYQKIKRIS